MIESGKRGQCMYCSAPFVTGKRKRLFCSDRCKVRYSREFRSCFYCGSIADTRDHITPHSTERPSSQKRQWSTDYVNACRECNTMLGNSFPWSLYDRIMYLHDKFKKKKKLHRAFVEWDEDDLEEVSDTMRTWIANEQQKRWADERRLSHMRLIALKVARFIADQDAEDTL